MNRISRTFLSGLVVGVPIILTVVVIAAAGFWLNDLAVTGVKQISPSLGDKLDQAPGVGIVLILTGIFLMGLAARFWLTAWLLRLTARFLERVPLVKTVYTAVRDMLRFFGDETGSMGKVVLYTVPGSSIRMLAILTNEDPVGLDGDDAAGMVAIWLPMSYMLGGYMLYVPATSVKPVDMSVERLMKLATTAEVGAEKLIEKP